MRNTIDSRKLEEIKFLDFIVPDDYNHDFQLLRFKEKHESEFYLFDKLMTDFDCKNTTYKFVAGKKYRAKIFKPGLDAHGKPFWECLEYLKDTGYFYANAQGLSLLYEIDRSFFPPNVHVWSPDELEDCLPKDPRDTVKVPRIKIWDNGQAEFHTYRFLTGLHNRGYMNILGFTEREVIHREPC